MGHTHLLQFVEQCDVHFLKPLRNDFGRVNSDPINGGCSVRLDALVLAPVRRVFCACGAQRQVDHFGGVATANLDNTRGLQNSNQGEQREPIFERENNEYALFCNFIYSVIVCTRPELPSSLRQKIDWRP